MILGQHLNKEQFESLIPHAGSMILIDEVDSWTEQQIFCRTRTHQLNDNPLRMADSLASIHLLEYGAQAMAIHGGLLSGKVASGFLAAVRDAQFYIEFLDALKGQLLIRAKAELTLRNGAVYQFTVTDEDDKLLTEARATVIRL